MTCSFVDLWRAVRGASVVATFVAAGACSSARPSSRVVAFTTDADGASPGVLRVIAERPDVEPRRMEVTLPVSEHMQADAVAAFVVTLAPPSWTQGNPPALAASGSSLLFQGVTEVEVMSGGTGIAASTSPAAERR